MLFFIKGTVANPNQDKNCTDDVWVYDLRTNMPSFGKRTPFTDEHLQPFERVFGEDPHGLSPRTEGEWSFNAEETEIADSEENKNTDQHLATSRWRKFSREWIRTAKSDSLDISWLKDKDSIDADNLPEPDVLAAEAMGELVQALSELDALMRELGASDEADAQRQLLGKSIWWGEGMSAGKLPEGWEQIEIGDIADVISGGTPKSGVAENFAPSGEGVAWLTPADLSGYKEKYISHGARDLTTLGYSSCSAKLMPKGTILFSSRAPVDMLLLLQMRLRLTRVSKVLLFLQTFFLIMHITFSATSDILQRKWAQEQLLKKFLVVLRKHYHLFLYRLPNKKSSLKNSIRCWHR